MNDARPAEGEQDTAVQAWLAEFAAVRQEIIFRMRNADYFMVINIMAMSAILGLGIVQFQKLLLTLPFVSFVTGFLYFNQLRHVQYLGAYIKDKIAPALSGYTHDIDVLGWERYIRTTPRQWAVLSWLRLPNALWFFLPSVAGLALTVDLFPTSTSTMALWAAGALLTATLAYVWFKEEKYIRSCEEAPQATQT